MYTTKKQFKVQIISILEEIAPFYWPKMHKWKGEKKIGHAPLPSFGQNPKERQLFSWNRPLYSSVDNIWSGF